MTVTCHRCKHTWQYFQNGNEYCPVCGKHKDRPVRKIKRRRHRPTKRGRNSGKVGTAKSK